MNGLDELMKLVNILFEPYPLEELNHAFTILKLLICYFTSNFVYFLFESSKMWFKFSEKLMDFFMFQEQSENIQNLGFLLFIQIYFVLFHSPYHTLVLLNNTENINIFLLV